MNTTDNTRRLRDASEGATVTIPDGWEPPADAEPEERQLVPGDRFTNDGSGDGVPWQLDDAARARLGGGSRWWDSDALAFLGLDVDPADDDQDDTTTATGEDQTAIIAALGALPTGSTLTFDEPRDFTPGADRAGIHNRFRITGLTRRVDGWDAPGVHTEIPDWTANFTLSSLHLPGLGVTADDFDTPDAGDDDPAPATDADQDDSTGDMPPAATGCDCDYCEAVRNGDEDERSRGTTFGTVSVKVVPETDDDGKALRSCACPACNPDADDDEHRLDEYQRERVLALDEALRVLDARRAPETADKARSVGDVFAPTGRPMVKPADLVTVAAFIADGTVAGGEQA